MELGQPTDRRPPFKFSAHTRVGFSDTDAQGIVYYGRYLPYFDQARVEYARHLGLLDREAGVAQFVMRASTVVYEAPARFDDRAKPPARVFSSSRTIGSCTRVPGLWAPSNPRPISTPLIAGTDISAPASLPSSFRSQCV